MRLARIGSVPALVRGDRWVDVAVASDGRFPHEDAVFAAWDEFRAWADRVDDPPAQPLAGVRLQAPRSTPRQVFGAGLNYHSHLADASRPVPDMPQFFTKFPTCICGPTDDVVVATDAVDFEAELVVVIGPAADRVRPAEAWDHVAALTVGQDNSAGDVQRSGQLSLGKSFRTFTPTGPWITTLDEVPDRDDIRFTRSINGETLQHVRDGVRRPPPAGSALRRDHAVAGRPRLHRQASGGRGVPGAASPFASGRRAAYRDRRAGHPHQPVRRAHRPPPLSSNAGVSCPRCHDGASPLTPPQTERHRHECRQNLPPHGGGTRWPPTG